MLNYKFLTINGSNFDQYGLFCVKNKKHPGYIAKKNWLMSRFAEGLKIKLIVTEGGKQAGFIEYIPGDYTWRVITAPGYLVIHCIWAESKKFSSTGMASALLAECVKDAELSGMSGVAVVTSDGSWMAGKDIYLKNGFQQVDDAAPHFQLLVKSLKSVGQMPFFPTNFDQRLKNLSDLQLLFTPQCPYIGKALEELPPVAEKYGAQLKLVEMKNASEAREKMPSPYGVFALVHNGRLLADHAISATRFKNILERELKLKVI